MPPQKIKTFYKPTNSSYIKTEDEILDAHADRAGLNRLKRQEQSGFGGKVKGYASRILGSAKSFAENHPYNNPKREPRESRPREKVNPRGTGRVSRVDKYEDGKVKETIYFSTNEKPPRKPRTKPSKQKQFARGAAGVLGDVGTGLNMSDFIPSNMGLGQSMGYGNPQKTRKKKGNGDWMDPGYIPPHLREFF